MQFLGNFVMVMCCSSCNVSCKHCYISYSGNMLPDELKEITLCLRRKYSVMINGAEPLVNLEYLKAYSGIQQDHILTNGLALMQEYNRISQELKTQGIKKISISYHFDLHEEISPISKEKLKELFIKLNHDGFSTRVMTTLTSKNYQNISQYCNEAYEMEANGIKFTNFIQQGEC